MSTERSSKAAGVGIGMMILWAAAAGLAARLPTAGTSNFGNAGDDQSIVSRIFGSSREVISKQLFMEADRTFHKGVSKISNRAFDNHLFIRWGDAITPSSHDELEGDDIAEILPWLRMAMSSDPHNIEAYSTTAYWLAKQGDMDRARTVLEEARSQNPGDYRVPFSLGKLYYQNKDHLLALKELAQARSLLDGGTEEDKEQTQLDLASILAYRAGSFKALGRTPEAIANFRELLHAFPNRHNIRKRLEELEKGSTEIERAETFWKEVISEVDKQGGESASHLTGGAGSYCQDHQSEYHDPDHNHEH